MLDLREVPLEGVSTIVCFDVPSSYPPYTQLVFLEAVPHAGAWIETLYVSRLFFLVDSLKKIFELPISLSQFRDEILCVYSVYCLPFPKDGFMLEKDFTDQSFRFEPYLWDEIRKLKSSCSPRVGYVTGWGVLRASLSDRIEKLYQRLEKSYEC